MTLTHGRATDASYTKRRRFIRYPIAAGILMGALVVPAGTTALATTGSRTPSGYHVPQHVALSPVRPANQPAGPHAAIGNLPKPVLSTFRRLTVAPHRVFTVNETTDTDATTPAITSHVCKDSGGKCSIRAAIEVANAETSGYDKIVIPGGKYTVFLNYLAPTRSMLISGAGASKTIIAGSSSQELFHVDSLSSPNVEIDGVSLRHGTASDGGAVYVGDSHVTLGSDMLSRNTASSYGGAIYEADFDSVLWVTHTQIAGNTALDGGGIYISEGTALFSQDAVNGNHASSASTTSAYGGGLYSSSGVVSILSTSFDHNSVSSTGGYAYGGGIYSDETLSFEGGSASHNTLTAFKGGYGGGVYNSYVAQFTSVSFDSNLVTGLGNSGGGVYTDEYATFKNCSADGNTIRDSGTATSDYGGGVYNTSQMLWTGGSVDGNSIKAVGASAGISAYGGGVYEDSSTTITGTSIDNNSLVGQTIHSTTANAYYSEGGAIYSDGALGISYDTLAHNSISNYYTYATALYIGSSDSVGATGMMIDGNSATATNYGEADLYVSDDFTLTDSTIKNESLTVTQKTGSSGIEYGLAYFGSQLGMSHVSFSNIVDKVMSTSGSPYIEYTFTVENNAHFDHVSFNGITNSVKGTGGYIYELFYFGDYTNMFDVSFNDMSNMASRYVEEGFYMNEYAHLVNVSMSHITNTAKGPAGYLDDPVWYLDSYSELENVSINAVTNSAGSGGYVYAGIFYCSSGTEWRNVSVTNTTNTVTPNADYIEAGIAYFDSPSNLRDVKILNTIDSASGAKSYVDGGVFYVSGLDTAVNLQIAGASVTAGGQGWIDGGAIYLGEWMSIDQAAIANVSAKTVGSASTGYVYGGGIYADDLLSLTNVTMANDGASSKGSGVHGGHGGAIYAYDPVTLTNDTLTGDTSSGAGGAIYSYKEPVTFKNTIFAGDSSPSGGCGGYTSGYFYSGGFNLGTDGSCRLSGIGDMRASPKLGPLANNGGFVMTKAELRGSPTIDAGDNSGCPAWDARGTARPQGRGCDMGAYEYVPPKKHK